MVPALLFLLVSNGFCIDSYWSSTGSSGDFYLFPTGILTVPVGIPTGLLMVPLGFSTGLLLVFCWFQYDFFYWFVMEKVPLSILKPVEN